MSVIEIPTDASYIFHRTAEFIGMKCVDDKSKQRYSIWYLKARNLADYYCLSSFSKHFIVNRSFDKWCALSIQLSSHVFNKRELSEEKKLMIHNRSISRLTIPYSERESWVDSGNSFHDLEVAAAKVLCNTHTHNAYSFWSFT